MKTQKIYMAVMLLFAISVAAQNSEKVKVKGEKTPQNYIYPVAVTPQNLEHALKEKSAAFVVRAFHNGFDTKAFEEKYGVRILITNCVGTYFANDEINNKTLADYLTKKFGEVWKKEIPIMPMNL